MYSSKSFTDHIRYLPVLLHHQQMEMVRHQAPSIDHASSYWQQPALVIMLEHKQRLTPKRQPFSLSFLFYSDPKTYASVLIISYLHIIFLCKKKKKIKIKNTVFLPLIKRKRLRQTITPNSLPTPCYLAGTLDYSVHLIFLQFLHFYKIAVFPDYP